MDPTYFLFADSSFADCPDTGRSTGGFHVFFQGGIIDSASFRPEPVTQSSAEAEYCNACVAAVAGQALSMLVQEFLGLDPDQPRNFPIFLDNQSTILMGQSFKDTKQTRHILRRFHFVRWMESTGRARLMWISKNFQMADPTTKNLGASSPTYVLFLAMAETQVPA